MIGEKLIAGVTLYFDGEQWWVRAERVAALMATASPSSTAQILQVVEHGWKDYEPESADVPG